MHTQETIQQPGIQQRKQLRRHQLRSDHTIIPHSQQQWKAQRTFTTAKNQPPHYRSQHVS